MKADRAETLIEDVYDSFRAANRWPKVYELQRRYGSKINVRVVAAKLGAEWIRCEQSDDPECHLTLKGMARLKSARQDLDLFAKCVGFLGKQYAANGKAPVSKAQLETELNVSPPELARVGVLLRNNATAWGSSSWPQDGIFTLHPSEDAVFYEGVTTYEDLRAVEQRLDNDRRELAQLQRASYLERLDLFGPVTTRRRKIRQRNAREPATYVDLARLVELGSIKQMQWDISRLVRLCEELNLANQNASHISVSLLIRALVDHVPPLFGHATFTEVANNAAGKSTRGNLQHLDRSLRNIADGLLHTQIRDSEALPSPTQVDFRADLDVLLGEVVRRLKQLA